MLTRMALLEVNITNDTKQGAHKNVMLQTLSTLVKTREPFHFKILSSKGRL